MSTTNSILQVIELKKHYPGTKAVDGVSFSITEGMCFGLLGPNGAGKTTTIEVIEGITKPTTGKVLYRNQPLGKRFRQEAGIQFQSTALQDFLSVKETLALFAGLYDRTLAMEQLVDRCQLQDLLNRDTRKLSGGQRQRLLLAIALINDPAILFLDEPTTGLDPHARRMFWNIIEQIKSEGKTIILTTHYMEEANQLCDDIVIMHLGRIIAQGSPDELLAQHFNDSVLSLPTDFFNVPPRDIWPDCQVKNNRVFLYTSEVNHTIEHLIQHNIPLDQLEIRRRTLEELFIHVTGGTTA